MEAQLEAARTTAEARAVPVEVEIISRARPGFRTVVVGEVAAPCAAEAASELTRHLAAQGRQAILLDCHRHDGGGAGPLGQVPTLGSPMSC